MPTQARVFVRRNRKGEIVRVITIHQVAPAPAPGSTAAQPSPPMAPKPLLEEISPDKLQAHLDELAKRSK